MQHKCDKCTPSRLCVCLRQFELKKTLIMFYLLLMLKLYKLQDIKHLRTQNEEDIMTFLKKFKPFLFIHI